ncbi:MAG: hypothetical protein ACLR6J_15350 [Parabacteroides merdae]
MARTRPGVAGIPTADRCANRPCPYTEAIARDDGDIIGQDTAWVAEHLGNRRKKIYKIYSIEEISEMSFTNPNCVLLMKAPNCALQRPALTYLTQEIYLAERRTK